MSKPKRTAKPDDYYRGPGYLLPLLLLALLLAGCAGAWVRM